jgi:general secretion pathway protein J
MPARSEDGVTLLELLVALAVFAVIGVAAYTSLFSVLDARAATERQSERLAAVQYAVGALAEDLRQAVDRPVRSIRPAARGPLVAQEGTGPLLRITRGGWPNPAGLPRSTLARVEWLLDDDRLVRRWRARPDAPETVEPTRRVLLGDVDALDLRFLDADGDWQERWPPLNVAPDAVGLPRAVEVTLDLADWGEVRRLFALPAGARPGGGGGAGGGGGDG